MQQTRRKLEGPGHKTRVSDLRAQFQAASSQVGKPPKPRKAVQRESDEERALKAERNALAQHTTSLLAGGNSKKPYKRPGEREERKKALYPARQFPDADDELIHGGDSTCDPRRA